MIDTTDKHEDKGPLAQAKQVPFGLYEYTNVKFTAADTDTLIPISLSVENLESLRWVDVTPNAGPAAKIYRNASVAQPQGGIYLRCSVANYATRLLLFTERREGGQEEIFPVLTTPDVDAAVEPLPDNIVYTDVNNTLSGANTFSGANNFTAIGNEFDEILTVRKGLQFPATQVASADANVLDDYEEGSFTPVIGGLGGTSGQTYTTQNGKYVKIGKLVWIGGYVVLSAKGTITGNVQIQGLPFPVANLSQHFFAAYLGWFLTATNKTALQGQFDPNQSAFTIFGLAAAAAQPTALATADIANNSAFEFGGTYITDN